MSNSMPVELQVILNSGTITAANAHDIRAKFYTDAKIGVEEATWLFALNGGCRKKDVFWEILFVEALTDFLVFQVQPEGHVDETAAQWLIGMIDSAGAVKSISEFELLINVLEKSDSSPEFLVNYALAQVKLAITSGQGPLRNSKRPVPACAVTADDVGILRQLMHAPASPGSINITRGEAEMLFDINDITAASENDPAWVNFFGKAIANHMMADEAYRAPSRAEALRVEKWLEDPKADVGGFFSRMVSGLRGLLGINTVSGRATKAKLLKQVAAIGESENISEAEALWFMQRLNRDGQMSEAEYAALSFLKRESKDIHPSMLPLLQQVA